MCLFYNVKRQRKHRRMNACTLIQMRWFFRDIHVCCHNKMYHMMIQLNASAPRTSKLMSSCMRRLHKPKTQYKNIDVFTLPRGRNLEVANIQPC